MGAIAHETGGLLIADGWIRFLGSGSPREGRERQIERDLPGWNRDRSQGFYLFADDVVGGFFALDGGASGGDHGEVFYWAPDHVEWENLDSDYSEFLAWAMSRPRSTTLR